jgi:hypothetical protein
VRAWALKEAFRDFWTCTMSGMIERHLPNVLTYFTHQ